MPKYKDIIQYTMEEFSRNRNFDRVFPSLENFDYYSKFINDPGEENIIFWTWYKSFYNTSGYDELLKQNNID